MFVTKKGLEVAKEKLEKLKEQLRQQVLDSTDLYHNAGDGWHDNPAWYSSQQTLQITQSQVFRLENLLKQKFEFIDDLSIAPCIVGVGTVVNIKDCYGEYTITILGPLEVSNELDIVSYESPIAKSLAGKCNGDKVTLENGVEVLVQEISTWRP